MPFSTETLLLILIVLLLLGGGGYYAHQRRGKQHPNHLVGVLVTVIIIAVFVRLLGVRF